jgi:riboflavin biosynthesis pyrimidine reductase
MLDVARELSLLYGSAEPPRQGVMHIMHVARDPSGTLSALRIGPASTPKSETDFFLVNASRAHADAVLTSAENLRREPTLSHALQGPWSAALTRYRHDVLQKREPLTCAILTRSGDLPYPHPVWSDGSTKLIFTPADAPPLRSVTTGEHAAEAHVIQLPKLDAVSATRWLRANGSPLVSVEAGPRTVRSLYEAGAVSELWLTRWESVTPDAEFAGALPEDSALFRGLSLVGSSERSERGQQFRFERWRAY